VSNWKSRAWAPGDLEKNVEELIICQDNHGCHN
jgi:hypothetical protein